MTPSPSPSPSPFVLSIGFVLLSFLFYRYIFRSKSPSPPLPLLFSLFPSSSSSSSSSPSSSSSFSPPMLPSAPLRPLRFLHLSDLHMTIPSVFSPFSPSTFSLLFSSPKFLLGMIKYRIINNKYLFSPYVAQKRFLEGIRYGNERKVDGIVLSGDLSNFGSDSEIYDIGRVMESIKKNISIPISVIPGNHDKYTYPQQSITQDILPKYPIETFSSHVNTTHQAIHKNQISPVPPPINFLSLDCARANGWARLHSTGEFRETDIEKLRECRKIINGNGMEKEEKQPPPLSLSIVFNHYPLVDSHGVDYSTIRLSHSVVNTKQMMEAIGMKNQKNQISNPNVSPTSTPSISRSPLIWLCGHKHLRYHYYNREDNILHLCAGSLNDKRNQMGNVMDIQWERSETEGRWRVKVVVTPIKVNHETETNGNVKCETKEKTGEKETFILDC